MLRTCKLMLKFSKYMLRTCRTYNSTLKFSKYEFYNKLLGGVTLLKITFKCNITFDITLSNVIEFIF